MKVLAVGVALAMVVPQAIGSPADVFNVSAPKVGAAPPKAQDIGDGDVSVATATGALSYTYPISLPPGRAAMAPSIGLTYSSQAPIYGGIAAGWELSGLPDIRWDGSRGLKDRERVQDPRDYLHYVSGLCGGRPLVEVTGDPIGSDADKTFRCQDDSSYARYERMKPDQSSVWRVLVPDGTTHYFGEQARISVSGLLYGHLLARAPLTRSVDPFGNTIEYFWTLDTTYGDYRIDHIDYTSNPSAGLSRFATVQFTWTAAPECFGSSPVGAQEDFKISPNMDPLFNPIHFRDGAWKLTQITSTARDPNNGDAVQHTRTIVLGYDAAAESCGSAASPVQHAPYRQLISITENAQGTNAVGATPLVQLPPIQFMCCAPVS